MSTAKLDIAKRALRREEHIPETDILSAVFARALVDPRDNLVFQINYDGDLEDADGNVMIFPQSFADSTARNAAVPTTLGQIGVQQDTGAIYVADGLTAGDWTAVVGVAINALTAITVTDATTPSITTAAGKTNTGFLLLNGKTSGGIKLLPADASGYAITVTNATQTVGVTTLTIPNFANVADTFAFVTLAQTFANKTLTTPVISTGLTASGSAANDFSGSTGTFLTSTGQNTIGGKVAFKTIATPVAATGAAGGVAGAAALGSASTVVVSSDGATKGVKFLTGVTGDIVHVINSSATACNLFAASGGTINGGATNAGCTIPASKGVLAICTAADTWTVYDLPAKAGAAA